MSLTKREIEHFSEQLPKGMKVVDFSSIKNYKDFVEIYCPESEKKLPYSIQIKKSLENFLKKHK